MKFFVQLAGMTLDAVLPPHCATCDAEVAGVGSLCAACFSATNFITAPLCDGCGLPFPNSLSQAPNRVCDMCAAQPPSWGRARAAMLYDAQAKRLILPLKYADRQENAAILAHHMARAGKDLLGAAELLVPIPLHPWRRLRRSFNQTALLAHILARMSLVPTVPDALRRTRHTPSLGNLSAAQRAQAVAGVFAINPRRHARVRGKAILLIDDVLTSGATAAACTTALLDAGARHVDLLVASRVADPGRQP